MTAQLVEKYKAHAQALLLAPDDHLALIDQFAHLSDNGQRGNCHDYLYLAKRAYNLAPDNINALFNYATGCQRAGHFAEAAALYKRGTEICPENWKARCWHHLGVAYRALGKNNHAISAYDRAIAIQPYASYRKDRALAKMAAGRLQEGFEEFEVRRELAEIKFAKNGGKLVAQQKLPMDVVHWAGEPLTGKTVVVFHEEGTGDFIQFCRFIPLLRQNLGAAKIMLTGPVPSLLDLVAENIDVDGIVPLDGPFESDYVTGSMTVPWRIWISSDIINGMAYFKAQCAPFPRRARINVGLVWRGNPEYGMDVHRSMAFRELCPLFEVPNVAFYSLQVGPAGREITNLGFDGFVADLAPFAKSWPKTARLIANLDAVVTVDTAVAHLAGALGVPAYVMVTNACDWRWLRNSESTPWYDSVRIIRQEKQDDWRPVIERVKRKLQDMARGRRQDTSSDSRRDSSRLVA